MERKLFSLLLIVLLFNTNFAVFGYAQEMKQPSNISQNQQILQDNEIGKLVFAEEPITTVEIPASTFACSSSSLSPQEVQNFHDLLATGFEGSELNAGTDPVKFREKLDNNSVVIPQIQEEGQKTSEVLAVKQDLPSEKISPNEVSYLLNNYYKEGAFAFGLEITDDLRIGQCKDSDKLCYLTEGGQAIRNDGEGIKQDAINVYEDFKKTFELEEDKTNLTQEQKQNIAASLDATSVSKELNINTISRTKNLPIQNSVKTDNFSAYNATDCNNGICTITTYSLFDKYFNSWFSMDLVLSNVGPTLLGKTKRLFNWAGKQGIGLDKSFQDVEKKYFTSLYDDDGLLTQLGKVKMEKASVLEREFDLEFMKTEMYAKRNFLSDGKGDTLIQQWFGDKGALTEIGKNAEKREAAFKLINQRYEYTTYQKEMFTQAKTLFNNSAQTDDDLIEYGRRIAALAHKADDDIALAYGENMLEERAYDLYKYAVKVENTDSIVPIIDNQRQWSRKVLGSFRERGDFSKLAGDLELSPAGNLKLYKIADDAINVGSPIPIADLELAIGQGKYVDVAAKLPTGEILNVSPATLPLIKAGASGGSVQLVKSGWVEAKELTRVDFANLMREWVGTRIDKAQLWTGNLRDKMIQKGWTSRKTYSVLDEQLAKELKLMRALFDPRAGAAKWVAYPLAYWGVKRGIFGLSEGISAYQLPDTWYQIEFYTDTDPIFDDAFIDFFSNSGSDQGDMFIRVINKIPWKIALNVAVENFNVFEDWWDKLSKGEVRSKAGNLAVYTSGPNECQTCGISISSTGGENFRAAFSSDQSLQSFILEDTPEKQKQNGQTIISYSHHMNVKGNSEEAIPIDLPKAIRDKTTCADAIEEAFIGLVPSHVGSFSGAILGLGETLAYARFGTGFGLFASGLQQLAITPKLQDCVDVEEGYYTHFLIPEQAETKKVESGTDKATGKVSELVKDGTDKTLELLKGGKVGEDALKPLKDGIEEFTGKTTQNKILEAIVKMNGLSTGSMNGIYLFYFWTQGGTDITPTDYKTDGQKNLVSADGNTVSIDYENGTISVNGKPIITSEDNVRLSSTNTAIPAEEIPNTITKISLPDSEELMFEMGLNSDTIVLNEDVLNCLKAGVLAQTGLELKSNNLSEAFGKTLSIITDTHPNVFVQNNKIVAEGLPRKIGEQNAKVQIKLNRKTLLLADNITDSEIGLMKSIQFKNGFIIFKPETNELLVWLKHHEDGIISGNDVTDLKPILTKTTNPLTGCAETAFDLKISGTPDSPFAESKVNAFNESLKHMGPFQIFDTETHKYILYTDEDCQERLKIINKETGEVYDQPITSIKQTPDGFEVTTEDGKNHDFEFGVDNGQPFIDYNGLREILRSATGNNGSFYYDPNKGLFYAENAQLLPLNESFKQQGINTQANPDGTVSSSAGGNPLNINIGGQGGAPISLPSLPENAMLLTLMMAIIIASFVFIQFRIKK
ncbi:MAG: hypothetical protein Q7S21_02140 [archaeon]|nr:hypothetical protein [archaeon]